jgi:hypothetical protein
MNGEEKLKNISNQIKMYDTILFLNDSGDTISLMRWQANLLGVEIEIKKDSKEYIHVMKESKKFSKVLKTTFVGTNEFNINDIIT